MRITAEPRSDQINADDLVGSPRTYTITGVDTGKAEQKYDISLEGETRVWRPPLTVLRTLIKCWGDDAAAWQGKRATLYCDEKVTFGREAVGGIRVSHVSGIDKPTTVSVTASRGKRQKVTIQPLQDAPQRPASIVPDTWRQIAAVFAQQGIEQTPGQWASQQLGRKLSGPEDITAEEGERLLQALTTGETP